MERWEYLTQTVTAERGYLLELDQDELNKLGNQGWELVHVLSLNSEKTGLTGTGLILEQCQLIFKRRKANNRA